MNWVGNFFKKQEPSNDTGSAKAAKERLIKVIVASENELSNRLTPSKIEAMKREIFDVVNCYVQGVDIEDVNISHRIENKVDMLELNISLSETSTR